MKCILEQAGVLLYHESKGRALRWVEGNSLPARL